MKNNIGLIVQAVLGVAVFAFSIFYFFEPNVLIILQSLTALFMFVLAYNNHNIFKRGKLYTIICIFSALMIIGAIIL